MFRLEGHHEDGGGTLSVTLVSTSQASWSDILLTPNITYFVLFRYLVSLILDGIGPHKEYKFKVCPMLNKACH